MVSLRPIISQTPLTINGFHQTWGSSTTIIVQSGATRDSTNNIDLNLGNASGQGDQAIPPNSATVLNGAINGINGLDTGTLQANQWYALNVIGDQFGFNYPALIISKTVGIPFYPEGYNIFTRIGWLQTNGSANFIKFWQTGSTGRQYYQWDSPILVLDGGTSASFASFSLLPGMPPQVTPAWLNILYEPNLQTDIAYIRPTGSTATAGNTPIAVQASTGATTSIYPTTRIMPLFYNNAPSLDYVVNSTCALSVWVVGFEDYTI